MSDAAHRRASTEATPATPAVPSDPAALAARDAELTTLFENDPNRYHYEDNGRWANEHLALRKAAQPKGVEQAETEQTEDDASTEADLLSDDDGADDGEGEADGDEAPETSVKPIGPGDDATDAELDAWRAEHGVPDDPTDYSAPAIDGIEWDAEALSPILEAVHAHNIPQAAVADALAKYAERVKEQQTEIRQRDRENAKAVRAEFSEAEIAAVKSAARAMPAELRKMLNTARLARRHQACEPARGPPTDRRGLRRHDRRGPSRDPNNRTRGTMLQAELAELHALRDRDISAYWGKWKNTGISGSDRVLQITRELGAEGPARPSAADLRAEQRELEQLSTGRADVFDSGTGVAPAVRPLTASPPCQAGRS